jgi:CheY-like chemotaxis protein
VTAGSWRVLVVDGSAASRAPIVETLRAAGAMVGEASSAQVALLTLEQTPCDQMVTNLSLPDADGYALLQAVRRLPGRVAEIKALALCPAGAAQETKLQAIMGGFHLVITQPCIPEHVALALRGIARLERGSAAAMASPHNA